MVEPFLRNAWYPAATSAELGGAPVSRVILGEQVAIYRTGSGVAAIGDICPHRFASLSDGQVRGDSLQCPYHGLRFGPDGTCTHNPHSDVTPPHARVSSWPTHESGGVIWVWPGSGPAQGLPPDFRRPLSGSRFAEVSGYLSVAADYRLVMDNLLDLSHVEYLHPHLSGGQDGRTVRDEGAIFEGRVEQDGSTISAFHTYRKNPVSPFFAAVWPDAPKVGQLHANMHWSCPSMLFFDLRMLHEDGRPGVRVPSAHLLTPAGADATHYFWFAWRDTLLDRPDVDQHMALAFRNAFTQEDEPMIAKVAQNMRGRDLLDLKPVILPNDNAAMRVRRLLARLTDAEA